LSSSRTGRLSHIARHYEVQPSLHIDRWSISLVIKGLLSQCHSDFNIAGAWKDLVGATPNSDLSIEWSNEDASRLKHKLEFLKGTPQELAAEAWRLAKHQSIPVDHSSWTTSESNPLTDLARGGWLDTSSQRLQASQFALSTEQADAEMSNYI